MSIYKCQGIAGSLVVISLAPLFIGKVAAQEVAVLVVSDEPNRGAVSRRSPVFRTAMIAVAQAMLRREGAVRKILVGITRVEPLELVPFHVDSDIERLPRGQTIH